MAFRSKLPHTVPESLKLVKKDVGPLVKARTHERKAEEHRQDDDAKAHLEFLERWRALEFTVAPIEARARHEWVGKLGTEPRPHEIIGHLIGSLPRARLDVLFKDPRIGQLNVVFGHRDMNRVIGDNELLQDLGITPRTFLDAKRDLKFQLGIQTYKSAQAVACFLSIVRAAVDPKVKKTKNFVKDEEVIEPAAAILRDVTTHIIEEMQGAHDSFFSVGDRRVEGEQFRLDRAKKSGRPAPPPDAPKGRPPPPGAVRGPGGAGGSKGPAERPAPPRGFKA